MTSKMFGFMPLLFVLAALPAHAQGIPITVSTFTTEKSCTTYELDWGREFAHADAYSVTVAKAWGSQLVRDCQQNFPGLRTTIAAAFASAGVPSELRGRRLTLTGRLTDVGYSTGSVATEGSTVAGQAMVVSVSFEVKDAGERIVYGGALTKRFPINASTSTASVATEQSETGRTTFSQLEREVAYAIARAVTFHVAPLRVAANDGHRIELNYGSPLVPLGAAIIVPHGGSLRNSRLNVTSATGSGAIADSEGGADVSDVAVGTAVTFAEADDPAANGRAYDRVDLPEN
jgi:hypothetical protein